MTQNDGGAAISPCQATQSGPFPLNPSQSLASVSLLPDGSQHLRAVPIHHTSDSVRRDVLKVLSRFLLLGKPTNLPENRLEVTLPGAGDL